MIDLLHNFTARALRPLSDVRGAHRLAMTLNRIFLNAGSAPLKQTQLRDGTRMWIDLRSLTENYSFYSGRYDDDEIEICLKCLRQGGNFVDVGGNIGMYSTRIARRLSTTQVFCFEPVPNNAERIERNITANGIGDRVQVFRSALSDSEGTAKIVLREDFSHGAMTGNASLAISDEADAGFRQIEVPIERFDDVAERERIEDVALIKIDIEGHEDLFIVGAQTFIARERPAILFEVNNWYFNQRGIDIDAALSGRLPPDYRFFQIRNGQLVQVERLAQFQRMENVLAVDAAWLGRHGAEFGL